MESKVKVFGHPLHPMLVAFPVAFYTSTLLAFIVYAISENVFWFRFGVVTNWAGVISAVAAAIPGLVDWSTRIPKDSHAKSTGLKHMLLNTTALVLFTINGILQIGEWNATFPAATWALILSAIGVALTLPAGFLGWSLVQDHHMGVHLSPEQERLEPSMARQPRDRRGPSQLKRG